jgi:hypothetical protein
MDAVFWRHCQSIGYHNGMERPQIMACQPPVFACFCRLTELAKISELCNFNGRSDILRIVNLRDMLYLPRKNAQDTSG